MQEKTNMKRIQMPNYITSRKLRGLAGLLVFSGTILLAGINLAKDWSAPTEWSKLKVSA